MNRRTIDTVAMICSRAAEAGRVPSPFRVVDAVLRLESLSRSLRRFAEHDCNRGLSDRESKARDAKEDVAVHVAMALAEAAGLDPRRLGFTTQRDPRGAMILVDVYGEVRL